MSSETVTFMNEPKEMIFFFSTVTKMSSEDLKKDDKDEERIDHTSRKAADEEVANDSMDTRCLPVSVWHHISVTVTHHLHLFPKNIER